MKTKGLDSLNKVRVLQRSELKTFLFPVVIFLFILLPISCGHYYKVSEVDDISNPDVQAEINLEGKYVILRSGFISKHFYGIEIIGDTIKGLLNEVSPNRRKHIDQVYKTNRFKRKDQESVINEVHIFIPDTTSEKRINTLNSAKSISFPLSYIQKVQLFDKNETATALSWVLPPVLTIGAVVGIVAATSCPFVYTYNGENYEIAGEIYGGATYASLERHDYLKLPNFKPHNGAYQLKLSNELREIQYTNQCELLMLKHPKDVNVALDKYGEIQSYSNLQLPKRAITVNDNDVTRAVWAKNDNQSFSFDDYGGDYHINGMKLIFIKESNVKDGKLILRAKNTAWADHAYSKFTHLFGSYYEDWNEEQGELSAEQMKANALVQDIPLSVYMETSTGWEFLDYSEIVGSLAYRELVIPLNLSTAKSDTFTLKIETGFKFWQVDYAAIDYTQNIKLNYFTLPLLDAFDENGADIKDLIAADDEMYLVQPDIGNEAIIRFADTVQTPLDDLSKSATIILHSKGYYERIREYTHSPSWGSLLYHKHDHSFSKFSYNQYVEAYEMKNNLANK